MAMEIRSIPGSFAGEVRGVDLGEAVSDTMRDTLVGAWVEHAVLVFRDQKLTPAQFLEASRLFGEPTRQLLSQFTLKDCPEVGTISSSDLPVVDGKLRVRGENYHTDHSNVAQPPKATMLFAIDIPSKGGDTQFVDVREAYDTLPESLRSKLLGLKVNHVYQSSRSPRMMPAMTEEQRETMPSMVQPLVIRHPDNGRAALYMNTGRMEDVEGMDPEEGFALINQLYDHATQNRFEYRHRWQPGDLVIWDNRSVMHQANADFDPSEKRFLYRIILKGAALIPA